MVKLTMYDLWRSMKESMRMQHIETLEEYQNALEDEIGILLEGEELIESYIEDYIESLVTIAKRDKKESEFPYIDIDIEIIEDRKEIEKFKEVWKEYL